MNLTTKWSIRFTKTAEKLFEKLDTQAQKRILKFLKERLLTHEDPRLLGKLLSGNLGGFWRYRVGDYRIICKMEDEDFVILVIRVDHRRQVYD
jgi:mRNA interferase RelE/StbE